MAYTAWSVVYGEQPTAAKWNQLGTNDAGFNDGTGIANNAILGTHLDTNLMSGWITANETWTYASASTFTISGDKTTKYSVGMKIKFTQTSTKYAVIKAVSYSAPNTTITIIVNTDYTVANAAITSPFYSVTDTPLGFPAGFTYTPTPTNITVGNGTLVGRYYTTGRRCHFIAHFTFGSSSSVSGNIAFLLPTTAANISGAETSCPARSFDAGIANHVGSALVYANATSVTDFVTENNGNSWGVGVPQTWNTNDGVWVSGSYEF